MKKLLVLIFIPLAFAACEQSSDTVVSMPNVFLDCQDTGCDASLDGLRALVVITKSGCENANFEPVASGNTTVTCDNTGCSGTVNTWTDANSNSVSEIISGTHDICGYIDVNQNLTEDTGDMISEITTSISSSSTLTLDSWSESN